MEDGELEIAQSVTMSDQTAVQVETLILRPQGSVQAVAPKRKREDTRSSSPHRARNARRYSRSPPRQRTGPPIPDVDPQRRRERERQLLERMAEEDAMELAEKPIFDPKAEFERLMDTRAGGTYVPPARLRALQAAFQEKGTKEHQRMAWEYLKKAINGLINKVNKSNIKEIAPALFEQNLVRGRGLYSRSIMRAQAASLPFTPIYAAITAIINTKLPQIGELLLTRLIVQLRKAFKRNDKTVCLSSTSFIAHLCNQQVAHEIVALQILALLLERPTDDSVEIAVGFMREVGAYLAEVSPKANNGVFERLRSILHEASIDKRVQYMIEVLFQIRKEKFKDHPVVQEELDLVEEEDQITHYLSLDDDLDVQETLGIFSFDAEYEMNEQKYQEIRNEILGGDSDDDDDDEEERADGNEDGTHVNGNEEAAVATISDERRLEIQDETNTNLTNLRRSIYLTIMSSVDFEECTHKLLKINLASGQERELCNMVIECCSQERTYNRFYGLIAERFCKLNRFWTENFEQCFMHYYDTIHRYDANKLRNISRLFGHLLSSNAITWQVMRYIHLNEEETTSSSRIFIKILFQDLVEILGLKQLIQKMSDPANQVDYSGLFPLDDPKKTRFSINYFTSIGLGAVTESMRDHLKAASKAPVPVAEDDSDDDSRSYSSYTGSSRTYSRSRSRSRSVSRRRARSGSRSTYESRDPKRGRSRARSYSRSTRATRSSYDSRSRSRSPNPRSRARDSSSRTYSRSRTPRRHSRRSDSRSGSYSRSRSSSDSRSRSRTRSYSPERRRRSVTPAPSTVRVRRTRREIDVRSRSRSPIPRRRDPSR